MRVFIARVFPPTRGKTPSIMGVMNPITKFLALHQAKVRRWIGRNVLGRHTPYSDLPTQDPWYNPSIEEWQAAVEAEFRRFDAAMERWKRAR